MIEADGNHALAPMLRKLSQWASFDEADEQALLALPHETRSLTASSLIVREGDKPSHSCLLISGFAYRHTIVGNGGRQILALHMRGDVVDLQNSLLKVADHNVQALSGVEVAYIPREAIQDLAFSHPRLGKAMWYDTLVDGSIHRQWTANIGRRDSRTRLAHLLCEFGVRLETAGIGDLCEYQLPMTQEQLADSLGLTPVHVNRTLMALDRDQLTSRTKRSVIIRDWKRLAEVGDFNAEYLHLEHQVD